MTATLLVRHTVESYNAWKPLFDEHEASRRSHGASGHRVLHDGNNVTVLIDFPDRASADGFTSDAALADVMKRAGVTSAPDISLLDAEESKSY
jgi:hypothetical protein